MTYIDIQLFLLAAHGKPGFEAWMTASLLRLLHFGGFVP